MIKTFETRSDALIIESAEGEKLNQRTGTLSSLLSAKQKLDVSCWNWDETQRTAKTFQKS